MKNKTLLLSFLICLIFLFSNGVFAAESRLQAEMPKLQSITAYDADGDELTLSNGEAIDIIAAPGQEGKATSATAPGLLIVPEGTATISAIFSPVSETTVTDANGAIQTLEQTIVSAGYSANNEMHNGVIADDAIKLEIPVEDLGIDNRNVGLTYFDCRIQTHNTVYITALDRIIIDNTQTIGRQCFFSILYENTPLYVQNLSGSNLKRGDTLLLDLSGKTSEDQQMGLYYSYVNREGETVTSPYGDDTDNLDNGRIALELSYQNFPFEDIALYSGANSDFYQFKLYTEIDGHRSPYLELTVAEPSSASLREVALSNYTGSYTSADLWLNIGATLKPNLPEESTVEYYLATDEDGIDRVDSIAGKTVKASEMTNVTGMSHGQGRRDGLRIKDLAAGEYYVVVKLTEPAMNEGEEANIEQKIFPFTVYENADAYVKAALDKLLNYYMTGKGSFSFNQLNENGEYEYYGMTKVNASSFTGDGRSWEAMAFTSLGTEYPYGDETFSFAIDGDVLASHVDGTSRLDQWNANPQERTFESTGAKSLFRFSMAAAAMGGDPRATAGGNDMIHELIRGGYVDYDIEKGELNLDAQGKLSIEPDGFALSYALLTLEICHATEEEGFTKEFREAGAKPILETLKQFNEKEGKSGVSADTVGMIFLPLHWLAEDEVLDADLRAEIKAELAKMNSVVAKPENRNVNGGVAWFKEDSLNNDLYAVNTNSMAVLMNMLVLNGATAEEIGSWQSEDGTLLTALIGTQLPDGQFGFSGMVDSWLATYQTLGALVDLYNGRSFYEYAQDTYDATYPQYSDAGQEVANQLKALPETIESVEDIEAVNEARTAYEAFMANLPEKADVAAVESYFADLETALSDAEAATTQFVKDLIEDLPEPDLQTEADAEAVSAARAAFDALTDDEAAAVTKAERAKLERAENAADTIAADEVERQLLALPAADKVVAADGEAITAARAAFEALTEDQQKLVSGEAAAKLVNDERALEQLGAAPVVHEIDAIPDAADLSLDDKDYVEQVRANYDALSDVQKLAVTNVADLIKAETKLQKLAEKAAADEAAAAAVDEAIADLGKAENIGVNDEDAVKAARKAFDKLSDDAKALVTAEDDLIAAEEALAAAKDEAAKAAAAEEAAEKAEKAIDDIGDVTLDSEKAIAKAREIYDALSDDEKALVENGDALAAAEEALAQLKDEAEQAAAEEEAAAKAAADQKAAAKVAAAIDAIGDVTLGDEKAIAKARNDYDALTDDQKDLVDNAADLDAAEAALDQLKEDKAAADEAAKEAADKAAADRAAADAVQSAIDALGEGDDITAADAKAVSAARKAYDRLTDDQKALVDNEDALTAAEEAVAAAKEAAVKEAEEAAKEAEEQAKAAEEAERAAKEAADKAAADKAAADKAAADKAAADAVQSAIDALGESDDITATDAKAVSAARKAYDRLTDDQKALVDNEDALTAAEDAVAEAKLAAAEAKAAEEAAKAIAAEAAAEAEQAAKEAAEQAAADKAAADKAAADKAAADAVQSAIDALGESDDITAADGKAVSAARKAYDRLTDDQKALVDNEAALTAAEDAVAQAKADAKKAEEEAKAAAEKAAKDAADKEAAAAAEKAIEAIGEVTKDSAAAVEAARAAFDALTDDQKALVGNEETLKAAEEKLAALSNRRFVDVPADAYFSEAVDWAVANNITTGTDDTHFSPNDGCTRAQVVTFLWRAAGSPAAAAENPFSDVAAGSYYEKAVLWAVENGITTGTGEGTFSPNDVCTRSQVVTFLWRAKGSPAAAGENPFSDVEAGSFYEQAVLWAVANSVTTGTGDTTFGPKETCTRGQVVTFLFRAR